MKLHVLSAADLRQALPMREAVEGMKRAYAQLSTGKADIPLRGRVKADGSNLMLSMPAYMQETRDLAVKIVTIFPENTDIPMIHAMVMAFDPDTGIPLAVMEGGTLTAIRTGAGAGAAADYLARDDSKVVTVIGSGVQARSNLEAICAVRVIEKVFVHSRNRANAERFAAEMAGFGLIPQEIEVVDDVNTAVGKSDIVIAATTSTTPVFVGSALKRGTHVSAVGSYTPQMQEVDTITIEKSLVTVDSRVAALAEAGDLIIPIEQEKITEAHIYAEIGEIAAGMKAGRTSHDQITYFKSVGVGAQDAVAAGIAVQNALFHHIGTEVDMG